MTDIAAPSHARAHRGLRAAVGVLVAALVLVAGVLVPGSALAAVSTPSPSPTAGSGEVVLTAAPAASGMLRGAVPLDVAVALDNGLAATSPTAPVTLSIGTNALPDRAALSDWLAGDTEGVPLQQAAIGSLAPIAAGERGTTTLSVGADDPLIAGRAPGVYPLLAAVSVGGVLRRATSVVVVPDDESARTPVALVVPITAGARSSGLLPSTTLAALTAADGLLSVQLDAVSGTNATLAIDPSLVASVRVLGASAPASAAAWLNRLEALPNARFALQFGDADVSLQLADGRTALLQPTSLTGFMSAADFPPAPAPTASPTPSASATSDTGTPDAAATSVLPSLAELLDVGSDYPGVFWTPTGSVDGGVVSTLTSAHGATATLIDSNATAQGEGGRTVPARASVGGAELLVYDEAISAALRDASTQTDAVARGAAVAAASAGLTFAAAQTGGAPLLVTVDRPDGSSAAGLRAAIDTLVLNGRTTPSPLSSVLTAPAAEQTITGSNASARRSGALTAFAADEVAIADLSTVLDDPSMLTGRQRAEELQLIGSAWLSDDEAWRAAMDAHSADTAATLNAVSVLPPSPLNLLSSDADLRFWIRNDLPWPVSVVFSAAPDNLRLEVASGVAVDDAPPASNTRVQVPVQAKIGNGDVRIRLSLTSPSGVAIGTPQVATVNVRADWERIGLIVLGVAIVLLLGVGGYRTIQRRRRGRDVERTDPA